MVGQEWLLQGAEKGGHGDHPGVEFPRELALPLSFFQPVSTSACCSTPGTNSPSQGTAGMES